MPRYLGLNISDEIANAIAKRTEATGESKTTIATIALEKELGIAKNATLSDRLTALEIRIAAIEARLDAD